MPRGQQAPTTGRNSLLAAWPLAGATLSHYSSTSAEVLAERPPHQQESQQCMAASFHQGIRTSGYSKNVKANPQGVEGENVLCFESMVRFGESVFAVSTTTLKTGLEAAILTLAICCEPPRHLCSRCLPRHWLRYLGLLGDTQMYTSPPSLQDNSPFSCL